MTFCDGYQCRRRRRILINSRVKVEGKYDSESSPPIKLPSKKGIQQYNNVSFRPTSFLLSPCRIVCIKYSALRYGRASSGVL